MPREVIATAEAPGGLPYYSQAVKVGGWVFVSGTVGVDPATGKVAGPTFREQAHQALTNCRAILQAAQAGLDDVVDVHVLLLDPADAAAFNEVYLTFFPADPPARCVSKLGVDRPGILVSVKMTAVLPETRR